jgi:hypothetical protein
MQPKQPEWEAAELFCPKCKQPRRVKKRMLLVLAQGDKYDYICSVCGEVIGAKLDKIPGNFGGGGGSRLR